jgi:hypothetical protein
MYAVARISGLKMYAIARISGLKMYAIARILSTGYKTPVTIPW